MPKDRQNNIDKSDRDFSDLRLWMESPEGRMMMDRLAHSVRDTVVSRNLPLSFVSKDPFGSRTDSTLLEEIHSELVIFFLENAGQVERRLMSGDRNFPFFIKQRFLSRWLSGSRNPSTDPFRYLYKRAQDLLREQEGFFTLAKKGRSTAFSKKPQNRAIPPLVEEDLRIIPFPPEYNRSPHDGAIKTKAAILGLADYFWGQIHELWGKEPVWVDIRDFISWIGLHVPLKRAAGEAEFQQDSCESQAPHEGYWDPAAVKSWALLFFNQIDRKQLLVFQLFHQENLTLKRIALKMGYKGSSGPKYVVDHITARLQFFLRDLPWLSPDDLEEEAFALFFDTLFALLKNSAPAP